MPGLVGKADGSGFASVKLIEAPRARAALPRQKPAARPASMVEVVLVNGRTLRVAETIAPEVLGRLAVALEG